MKLPTAQHHRGSASSAVTAAAGVGSTGPGERGAGLLHGHCRLSWNRGGAEAWARGRQGVQSRPGHKGPLPAPTVPAPPLPHGAACRPYHAKSCPLPGQHGPDRKPPERATTPLYLAGPARRGPPGLATQGRGFSNHRQTNGQRWGAMARQAHGSLQPPQARAFRHGGAKGTGPGPVAQERGHRVPTPAGHRSISVQPHTGSLNTQ